MTQTTSRIVIFCVVVTCSLLDGHQLFGGNYGIHLQGRKRRQYFLQKCWQTLRRIYKCRWSQESSLHCKQNFLFPWPESASELHRQSDRRVSANLVPTFGDRGCLVVSVTEPNGRNTHTQKLTIIKQGIYSSNISFLYTDTNSFQVKICGSTI
jgi:hypothetical protein